MPETTPITPESLLTSDRCLLGCGGAMHEGDCPEPPITRDVWLSRLCDYNAPGQDAPFAFDWLGTRWRCATSRGLLVMVADPKAEIVEGSPDISKLLAKWSGSHVALDLPAFKRWLGEVEWPQVYLCRGPKCSFGGQFPPKPSLVLVEEVGFNRHLLAQALSGVDGPCVWGRVEIAAKAVANERIANKYPATNLTIQGNGWLVSVMALDSDAKEREAAPVWFGGAPVLSWVERCPWMRHHEGACTHPAHPRACWEAALAALEKANG